MGDPSYPAAIIGCGKIGSDFADTNNILGIYTHAQAYLACTRTVLAAVCDLDPARAEACARRWGVARWYSDPNRMMAEVRPALVSLCTPDETHAALALQMLTGPVPPRGLLCEKPLALHGAEARRVVQAAEKAGAALVVNYTRRYLPNLRAVRDLIRSGELGRVQAVQGWYTKGVLHNGTHWFDLVRFLLGEVRSVEGRLANDPTADDPGVDVQLELVQGARAHLTSCAASAFTVFEMDIMMERGRLELREAALRPRLWVAQPSVRFAGYTELMEDPRPLGDARDSLLFAVQDLVEAVEAGRVPACSGRDGLAALAIGEAALTSARDGGAPVRVAYDEG